ncbi:ABC transporter ATP-binding protein [Paracoccus rhizosphaerae]|uniref:ABC transporter ATP-binding protein n=1 Tax=Paracoccus rhizosphaerae TaxID=1133347 RepID=A0ABV6CH92_9RHOB|nr:ATP-binding cassette domain-containing protein [Paracoccus rhizosphaerae]
MSAPALRLQGDLWIGDNRLARDLKITAPAGRWTCLLGPSGVGKSTLGRLVAGLPGRARLDGDATAVRGRVAMLAQQDQLLPWASALQNVTLGARLRGAPADHRRARDLLDRVGLAGLHHRRPATLSGGQRQRVALARTMIEDSPVVVLDEPFSALDAGTRMAMQDLAARLLAGQTVLLITHDPLEAARLGHAAFLMTAQGSRPVNLPEGPTPRDVSDLAVTAAQAAIFDALSQRCAA